MPRIITPGIIAEFRRRLCVAASELLAERGIEGFSMREVAKRVRVSPMTTYRYFRDKNDILSELRDDAFSRLTERLRAATASINSLCEATMALAHAYSRFAQEEPVHYRLMFDLLGNTSSSGPSVQESLLRSAIHEHVELLVAMGVINGDPDVLAQVFWSTLHGVTALHLTQRIPNDDLDRVLCDVMASFLRCDRDDISSFAARANKSHTIGTPIEPDIAAAA